MFLSTERKNPTVVLSARNAVTLPEIVPINLPKLFVLSNIFNILLCYLRMRMSNQIFQNTQDDQTTFLIAESSTVQTVNHVSTIPRPSLKMSILPSKFHKPVPVIGFIDTGANTSMIDPSDFAKKFLYKFFFNAQTKKPDRFPNLCMEHLFLTGLTLSSLSICEDELWYMWCLTALYATKLVLPIKPVLITLLLLSSHQTSYGLSLNGIPHSLGSVNNSSS
ncbi:hypothetical protein CUMW_213700 [Citrus unshiu]|uniref:Uncharacterized protein n=1 Tax=Citrus unshiu TaxID=55188 RepID=A0A2H5QB95_CITUN|nr:hypothetical protein CUMW_213700 [Citrus unshiu]